MYGHNLELQVNAAHRHAWKGGKTSTERKLLAALAAAALIALWLAPFAAADGASHSTVMVYTHPSQGPMQIVPGAYASLTTNDNGVTAALHTNGLVPGNAYTVRFVAINNPAACANSPCSGADVLGNPAGVQAEMTFLAGHVVGADGIGNFAGHIAAGAVPGGFFGNGLNVHTKEIHLVVQEHGPVIPGLVANIIHTVRGGCTDASVPPAYPPAAKADGIPGPNTCRGFQLAIFQ
jgi:hypothetical protein